MGMGGIDDMHNIHFHWHSFIHWVLDWVWFIITRVWGEKGIRVEEGWNGEGEREWFGLGWEY